VDQLESAGNPPLWKSRLLHAESLHGFVSSQSSINDDLPIPVFASMYGICEFACSPLCSRLLTTNKDYLMFTTFSSRHRTSTVFCNHEMFRQLSSPRYTASIQVSAALHTSDSVSGSSSVCIRTQPLPPYTEVACSYRLQCQIRQPDLPSCQLMIRRVGGKYSAIRLQLSKKNGGKGEPEMRIPALIFGSLFVPVGLL
jgi:hypothetical protein